MEELIKSLKRSLASHFAFYLKVHGFHWNVEGPNFPQYHALFETIYTEIYSSIDKMAEEIRTLGSYTPASFTRFSELSDIKDEISIPKPQAMIDRLLIDIETIMSLLQITYNLAEENHNHGLSNFLAERMDAFKKHAWQLRATNKQV